MATAQTDTGRSNQKKRTRTAIVEAARGLIGSGSEVTMPEVARAALVSEATAYRYFPDLPSLIGEALAGVWPDPVDALGPVADSRDPVERIAFACEFLLRGILARQGGVRAMMAATIVRPDTANMRPGIRFGLIDHALSPLAATLGTTDPDALTQLKRSLAVVMGADALFTLTDLLALPRTRPSPARSTAAKTLTEAAVRAAAERV